ncbi:MAG: cysteine desulfurase [Clostridia bacterium]|nr:cysteine desulfurase [Clostridia bacterium]
MRTVYFDNASTSPLFPEVAAETYRLSKEIYGNPSSLHAEGKRARALIDNARNVFAKNLGCNAEDVFFTSCGSESNTWAIFGAADLMRAKGKTQIVVSNIEHASVTEAAKASGLEVVFAKVGSDGTVPVSEIERTVNEKTALVSVMYANNETGIIQPVKAIAKLCRERGVLFHTDAVQAAGHINIDLESIGADMAALSAHKFGGPKGTGALILRGGLRLPPMIFGGGQERGMRSGTENVVSIYGAALALELSLKDLEEKSARIRDMRDMIEKAFLAAGGVCVNGASAPRLPGISSVCFENVQGESLVYLLDMAGYAASSGAACSSGKPGPSRVLTAMGVPEKTAEGALRVSVSEHNTQKEAASFAEAAVNIVRRTREVHHKTTE